MRRQFRGDEQLESVGDGVSAFASLRRDQLWWQCNDPNPGALAELLGCRDIAERHVVRGELGRLRVAKATSRKQPLTLICLINTSRRLLSIAAASCHALGWARHDPRFPTARPSRASGMIQQPPQVKYDHALSVHTNERLVDWANMLKDEPAEVRMSLQVLAHELEGLSGL